MSLLHWLNTGLGIVYTETQEPYDFTKKYQTALNNKYHPEEYGLLKCHEMDRIHLVSTAFISYGEFGIIVSVKGFHSQKASLRFKKAFFNLSSHASHIFCQWNQRTCREPK